MQNKGMTVITAPKHGDRIDALDTVYPTEMLIVGERHREENKTSTSYGYVISGRARASSGGVELDLPKGGFFCLPGEFVLEPDEGVIAVIRRHGYRGQRVAGTLEERGRLSYIDGCSDSLLVYPPRLGDPCLNFLHFPPGIAQTQHTHPTVRFGIVARGKGKAFRVPSGGSSGWEIDLTEGCVFLLDEQEQHSFRTDQSDSIMDVVAYHPDSDWGPTDATHPMRNRTYIGNDRTGQAGT